MARIRVGLAGCGFVSELHMYAYRLSTDWMSRSRLLLREAIM